MDNVEVQVMEIDGKQYFVIDNLGDGTNSYYYFSNIKDNNDVIVLKDEGEDLVSIENDRELDYALDLFYEKYKDASL